MATIDITIGNAAYTALDDALDGIEAKLEPLRTPLGKVLRNPAQRAKAITMIKSDDGRLLKRVHQFKKWLDQWYDDIGWEDSDG